MSYFSPKSQLHQRTESVDKLNENIEDSQEIRDNNYIFPDLKKKSTHKIKSTIISKSDLMPPHPAGTKKVKRSGTSKKSSKKSKNKMSDGYSEIKVTEGIS